jgi:hypothetical protein
VSTHQGEIPTTNPVRFDPDRGHLLTVNLDGLDLRLAPVEGAKTFVLCQ